MAAHHKLSARSKKNLRGVDPDLIAVCRLGLKLSQYDFIVTEGLRTTQRQRELVSAGASRTMKSKHLTGNAFDIAVCDEIGKVTWDFKYYKSVALQMERAAKYLGIDMTWGGRFRNFVDGPHFQLNK